MIFIDFETYLISEAQPIPKPVCLSYYDGETGDVIAGMLSMKDFLTQILTQDVKIGAHNAQFEGLVITKWFPELRDKWQEKLSKGDIICTKVNEQLLDVKRRYPWRKYDLATLVEKYFKEDISEDKKNPNAWRLRYHELDGVPVGDYPKEAYTYALEDSIWAYKCYLDQDEVDAKETIEADYYLNLMGLDGISIDKEVVKILKEELINRLIPAYKKLNSLNYIRIKTFNGLDSKGKKKWKLKFEVPKKKIWTGEYTKTGKKKYTQKQYIDKEYLELQELSIDNLIKDKDSRVGYEEKKITEYIEKNIPFKTYTKKGGISKDSEALASYIKQKPDSKLIKNLLIVKEYDKILSAFISRLEDVEVCRTQYNPCVSTGRTSSRTSTNFPSVNIQQMPREVRGTTYDIRNCFIARPGYHIVSIDYSGLELTVCANQLKSYLDMSNMADIINAGGVPTDMHSMFAYRIKNLKEKTNITYDDFVKHKKEPGYKEYRQLAKPINLGFPGGIGYDTMRSLLFQEGIEPKYAEIERESVWQYFNLAKWYIRNGKSTYQDPYLEAHDIATRKLNNRIKGYQNKNLPNAEGLRVRRVSKDEYAIVYDELVILKRELFSLYPDLEYFLKGHQGQGGHYSMLTGDTKKMPNDWGEVLPEPMYSYKVGSFERDFCMYTQVCNGFLMQAPAAQGFKKWMVSIIKKYQDDPNCRILAGIHDEVIFEVKIGLEEKYSEEIASLGIDKMHEVIPYVRIAMEADCCGKRWSKVGDGSLEKTYWKEAIK